MSIERLSLSLHIYNAFRRAGIATISQMIEYYYQNKRFMNIAWFGKTSEKEVSDKLAARGIKLEITELSIEVKI